MKNNQLDIIVPIFNVEKYLKDCLDSFVNQSVKCFNVLLIDDGSTDSSSAIAESYSKKYPDIFTYHKQENKGLGGARNTGLKLATSQYVFFFDSDDFMANRAVEHILEEIKAHHTDIIFFNPIIFDMSSLSYKPWHDSDLFTNIIFKDRDVINPKDYPILHQSEASVCRAVFKREFLLNNNISFLEHVKWEDVPPHFLIMHNATSASFMDYVGAYYYRINSGQQITSGTGKSRLDMKYIYQEILPYFKSKDWRRIEKAYMISFLSNYLFWSLHTIDDSYRKEFVGISHSFFKKVSLSQYMCYFFKTKSCLRNKIMIWFLKSNILYKVFESREKISKYMKVFKIFKKA